MSKDHLNRTAIVDKNGKATTVYKKSVHGGSARLLDLEHKLDRDLTASEFFSKHLKSDPAFRKFTQTFDNFLAYSPYRSSLAITDEASAFVAEMRSYADAENINHFNRRYPIDDEDQLNNKLIDKSNELLARRPVRESTLRNLFGLNKFGMTQMRIMQNWDADFAVSAVHVKASGEAKTVTPRLSAMYDIAYNQLLTGSHHNPEPYPLYVAATIQPLIRSVFRDDNGSGNESLTVGKLMDFLNENPMLLKEYAGIDYYERTGGIGRYGANSFERTLGSAQWVNDKYRQLTFNARYSETPIDDPQHDAMMWLAWSHHQAATGQVLEEHRGSDKAGYAVRSTSWNDVLYNIAPQIPFKSFIRYYDAGHRDTKFILKMNSKGIDPDLSASLRLGDGSL